MLGAFSRLFNGQRQGPPNGPRHGGCRPTVVVLEGLYDMLFLRRVSTLLHQQDPGLPDLMTWERQGRVLLLPRGGGDNWIWATCLSPLGFHEFHLLDKEQPPATQFRRAMVEAINRRPRCQAMLTSKRSLENYFHNDAIRTVLALDIEIDDESQVVQQLTEAQFRKWGEAKAWNGLRRGAAGGGRNVSNACSTWRVLPILTAHHLAERDPAGEVGGWLWKIGSIARRR